MKKAFTLIEFMVVVAILSVLFVLVAAAVSESKNPAQPETRREVFYPKATGYVVDTAGVLKSETMQTIETDLRKLDPTAQVAVVTVKTIQPLTIEEYSIKLAEKWKPGYKGKDNGIIFIIVTEDRKVRIEVGRGLEGVINDAKAGQILDDSVVPFLKNNDWDGGVMSGVKAISGEVSK